MKKIDEAVKRFGTPDYGRTAKRLRDFENGLLTFPAALSKEQREDVRRDFEALLTGPDVWCCDDMTVSGYCHVHSHGPQPWNISELFNKAKLHEILAKDVTVKSKEIEALQQLLNEKDYEIDMLRNIKPVSTRDLWIAAGLVGLVLLGAYCGFM